MSHYYYYYYIIILCTNLSADRMPAEPTRGTKTIKEKKGRMRDDVQRSSYELTPLFPISTSSVIYHDPWLVCGLDATTRSFKSKLLVGLSKPRPNLWPNGLTHKAAGWPKRFAICGAPVTDCWFQTFLDGARYLGCHRYQRAYSLMLRVLPAVGSESRFDNFPFGVFAHISAIWWKHLGYERLVCMIFAAETIRDAGNRGLLQQTFRASSLLREEW